jgi:molecular chaperone DnaK
MHASILNVESGEQTTISLSTTTSLTSGEIDQFTADDDLQEVGSKFGGKFIGIDLGTSYSAISTIDDNGNPKIIRNSEGQESTPTCLLFEGDTITVGGEARRSLGFSKNALTGFKRDMGRNIQYTFDGKSYTPSDCSALVLKKLFQDAQEEIGDIGETVVTIPANYTNEARVATLTAAKQAGLNVQNLIEEPSAAALYYAFKGQIELNGYYAIFSLGHNSFDISLIKANQQNINALASEGVQKLGGGDFDIILQKIIKKKFKDEHNEAVNEQDYTKTDAEEDKKSLTKREAIYVRINKKRVSVTRAEFEKKISSLIIQTEMLCENILSDQNLTTEDIQAVLMVGGNTKIPLVQKAVERIFKQKPTQSVNVDEVIVLGASLYAAFKGDQSKPLVQQKSANKILKQSEDDDSSEIDKWLLD